MLGLLISMAFGQTFVNAETPNVNAQNFRPTVDSRRTMWTDDAMRGAHDQVSWRLLFHYTDDPLVYEYSDGTNLGIVSSIVQADLLAAYQFQRLRVGLDLPVYLFSTSDVANNQGGLGDLGLDAKFTLLDGEDAPLDAALSGRLTLPTASVVDTALGDENLGWELSAIVDRNIGNLLLAANLGLQGAPRSELENIVIDDFFAFRTAASYEFDPAFGTFGEFVGQAPLSAAASNRASTPLEWMAGAYGRPVENLAVRGGFGQGLTSGIGAPDYRIVLGVGWEPALEKPVDTDGDGLVDELDACPDTPEDADGIKDDDGCPEEPSFIVKVVDAEGKPVDATVMVKTDTELVGEGKPGEEWKRAGTFKAVAMADGYEPGAAEFVVEETDEGKVITVVMAAAAAGTLKVTVRDESGAPVDTAVIMYNKERIGRGDHEGTYVPSEGLIVVRAPGFKPYKETIAVVDGEETVVAVVLVASKAELVGDRIDIKDSVYFDTAKATIKEISFPLLAEVAEILQDHPELTKLRIEGHTDSRGSASYNKDLSNRRAASVRQHLIDKGVAAERLTSVGYGEEKPIDEAKTDEAYEKNRRVDFFVEERSDGPAPE